MIFEKKSQTQGIFAKSVPNESLGSVRPGDVSFGSWVVSRPGYVSFCGRATPGHQRSNGESETKSKSSRGSRMRPGHVSLGSWVVSRPGYVSFCGRATPGHQRSNGESETEKKSHKWVPDMLENTLSRAWAFWSPVG